MSKVESSESKIEETDLLPIIDGELIEDSKDTNVSKTGERNTKNKLSKQSINDEGQKTVCNQLTKIICSYRLSFLVVTLFGDCV